MIWRPTAQASRLCDALRLRATGRGWRMSTTPATAALHVQRFLAECPSSPSRWPILLLRFPIVAAFGFVAPAQGPQNPRQHKETSR
ncbi:hypothetical protein EPIRMAN_GEN20615_08955 [Ralstonia mannitolilytica]|nr:hypothetical protein TK49_18840 [Ralstonia mannitolilytica]CAJ0731156.1 hypothetical protein R76706_02613 [Ralstonia mannitolilytica]CAJ0787421.1 hypothetical protein R77555_01611 [Ralstonia mannitolilytica]